jgi:hypothetical protein
LLSAVATCIRCTPEHAVRLAIHRGRVRFPTTDWSRWSFTAEEVGSGRELVLRFTVDSSGAPDRVV